MKHEDGPAQMPLLRARLTSRQLGDIASDIAGTPSNALAIFVVGSDDPKRSERYASCVADFLHMLGNPVGVVKSSGSTSLERELDLTYPLSILDVQQTLSVCAEDGAAAMVFALNDRTLKSDALTSVNVDVIGLDSARDLRQPTPSGTGEDSRAGEGGEAASPSGQWASGEEPAGSAGDARDDLAQARQLGAGFGFEVDEQTHVARADAQSDLLAAQARSPRTATVSVNCRSPLPWLWRRGFAETTFAVRCAYLTNWLMERKTRHERRGNDDAYDRSAGGRGGSRQADRPADGRRRRRRSRCTGHVGGQRFAPGTREGSVFVAIAGERVDGHDFVARAGESGAVVALVQHEVDAPVAQIVVPDTVDALGLLAKANIAARRAVPERRSP